MKHTPGPWIVAKGPEYFDRKIIAPNTKIPLATLDGSAHSQFANAHLIAAAPEMLAALENFFVKIESASPELRRMVNYNEIEQAIKKAKGE